MYGYTHKHGCHLDSTACSHTEFGSVAICSRKGRLSSELDYTHVNAGGGYILLHSASEHDNKLGATLVRRKVRLVFGITC